MTKTLSIVVLTALAGAAHADLIAETGAKFAGSYAIDYSGGTADVSKMNTVFSNFSGSATSAFSSTDLASVWGDQYSMTGTGTLQELGFGIFNSSSGGNVGTIATATVDINFFRQSDSSFIGGLGVNIAPALAPGFFTTFSVSGLDFLGIDFDTTDIIMTQTIRAGTLTGGSIRAGVVSLNPVSVGSADSSLFIQSATVNGGTPGFYSITSGGNPIDFFLAGEIVVPTPASAALLGFGGLAAARRRR